LRIEDSVLISVVSSMLLGAHLRGWVVGAGNQAHQ
jgi:hypothetical protein